MSAVTLARGRAKWAEAELRVELAKAFTVAANAARIIDENDVANRWALTASEHEQGAAHLFNEAKALGHFGDQK